MWCISMNFLFNRLKGLNMYDISQMNITDKEMNDMRKYYLDKKFNII